MSTLPVDHIQIGARHRRDLGDSACMCISRACRNRATSNPSCFGNSAQKSANSIGSPHRRMRGPWHLMTTPKGAIWFLWRERGDYWLSTALKPSRPGLRTKRPHEPRRPDGGGSDVRVGWAPQSSRRAAKVQREEMPPPPRIGATIRATLLSIGAARRTTLPIPRPTRRTRLPRKKNIFRTSLITVCVADADHRHHQLVRRTLRTEGM